METEYLESIIKLFEYYKLLGDKTMEQLDDAQLFLQVNEESNSIAIIVKHLHGNMLSRFTDFLTTDGEKEWRQRDAEFDNDVASSTALKQLWEEGWACLLQTIKGLSAADLSQEIFIRNEGHSVVSAINRQLAHYASHVGQIVFIGKMLCEKQWLPLSIAKGNSKEYNADKFAQPKQTKHFTDEFLNKKGS